MINKEIIKSTLTQLGLEEVKGIDPELEFQIWQVDELDEANADYEVAEFIPGYYAIGSDGGGEMLAIELASAQVFRIPFIPMDASERILVAESLNDLSSAE